MKKNLLFVIIIAIAGVGVYINTVQNEFIWDDKVLISENDSIKDWSKFKENFTSHLYHGTRNASNFYRPILKLSFMIDYSIWKQNVLGWHITNIVLHVINAILIFYIFSIILKNRIASFITGMLFCVHPLFTSAVTYISGRGDPLALFFMLISFLLFIKTRYVLSILFFIFAVLTKETAIILPLLLFAYDKVVEKKKFNPVFYSYAVACVIYGILRATVFNFPFVPTLTQGSTLHLRLFTMAKIIFIYLRLLVLPLGLHMERDVPYIQSVFEPQVFASIIALVVIGYFVKSKIYRKDQSVFFGILWFIITLLPVSNIKALNMSMAEHWMYIPAIGLFSCAGIAFTRLAEKSKTWNYIAWIGFSIIVLFFSYLTVAQNRVWKNDKIFYEYFLRYVPMSYVARSNMGNIYYREGKIDRSIEEYKKALEICPHYEIAHHNLAHRYLSKGDYDKAIWHGERVVAYFPTLAQPRYQLGILYEYNRNCVRYALGFQRDKAIAEYKKAIEIDPGYFWPHFNLAVLYEFNDKGYRYSDPEDMKLAKTEYEKALAIDPQNEIARKNLQILLEQLGE